MHELTGWSKDLTVEVAGRGIVAHTGSVALRALTDRTGLTGALSSALARRGSPRSTTAAGCWPTPRY